jgi:hypothetical protein
MSVEFAARLGWTEVLGGAEAKVLNAALQAALEVPGEELEELNESENELLDALSESILGQDGDKTPDWVKQMGGVEREAVGACLLWLQYPEQESVDLSEVQWEQLEEVSAAVGARLASLREHELALA